MYEPLILGLWLVILVVAGLMVHGFLSVAIMTQIVQLELRVNVLIEDVRQLRARNQELFQVNTTLKEIFVLHQVRCDRLSDSIDRLSDTMEEFIVQQTQDRRNVHRLTNKVQALMMWLPWLNGVYKWWCRERLG
jgi:hypothetical protein